MEKRKKSYNVNIERDESGWWVATVSGVAGVHTQARSLATLRDRVREAVEAANPRASSAVLKWNWRAGNARDLVEEALAARNRADKETARARGLLRRAALALQAKKVGLRDAGELLGLSFQRVQQLVDEQGATTDE